MRLIKFLSLLEKIIIALIILCFIPIAIFAYLPQHVHLPDALESAFTQVALQAHRTGFLTSTACIRTGPEYPRWQIVNELCLDRCTIGTNCLITPPSQSCPYAHSYVVGQSKVCSVAAVLNQHVPADTVSFEENQGLLPLDSIQMAGNQTLLFNYYCINSVAQCRQLIDGFGHDPQEAFTANYQTFTVAIQYLMYFGLLPLIAHTVVVFLLDSCGKLNLRLTNSLMIIHEALIGAGIIIAGIAFNTQNDEFEVNINKFASQCLIGGSQCQQLSAPFATFRVDDGVSPSFVTIMCFILAVEALLLVGVVVLNVLMVKYYKLREIDPSFSGYELQTL